MEIEQLGDEAVGDAVRRLRKIEGQVRGLQKMIEDGRECEDVLRQIGAAASALRRVGVNLAVSGLERCVTDGAAGSASTDRLRKAFLELS